jgi:hypothetical protein
VCWASLGAPVGRHGVLFATIGSAIAKPKTARSDRRPRRASSFCVLCFEAFHDALGDEGGDVAAETEDALDESGADVGVLFRRHHEEGFELGVELAVHHGHLELVLVVGDGADAAEDGGCALLAGEVDQEAVEGGDGDVADGGDGFGDHLETLGDGEERGAFLGVAEDGDDELVDDFGAAGNQVEMAVGERVEGAGVDGLDGMHATPAYLLGVAAEAKLVRV